MVNKGWEVINESSTALDHKRTLRREDTSEGRRELKNEQILAVSASSADQKS